MSETNKATLATFLDRVWSNGSVEEINRYITETYTIHNDPGDPWDGQTLDQKGFRDRLVRSRAPFPDQVFTVLQMLAQDDKIAVNWSWIATHLGDLPGLPATGKTITMTGFTLYGFEAGRITGHWQVCDRLGVIQQLQG